MTKKYGLPSDRAPHRSGSAILEQPGHVSQVNYLIMFSNMIFFIVEILIGPICVTVNHDHESGLGTRLQLS